jgi:hypothetical protein
VEAQYENLWCAPSAGSGTPSLSPGQLVESRNFELFRHFARIPIQ